MTNDEKKKIYDALAAPFPEAAIERTEGRITGRGYDTTGIKYQYVINRLNEVLGVGCHRAHRTMTVKEVKTARGQPAFEAICDLTLELGEWMDGRFVCWAESLADGGHTSTSEADARKGAYTNALKKAAAFFGVGKQAYEGTLDDDATPAAAVGGTEEIRIARERPGAPEPGRDSVTSRQLAALYAIAHKSGLDNGQFRQSVLASEGLRPELLSREAASRLITEMSNKLDGNGHADRFARQAGQEG